MNEREEIDALKNMIASKRREQNEFLETAEVKMFHPIPWDASELDHLRQLRDMVREMILWNDDATMPGRLSNYVVAKDAVVQKFKSLPPHAA